jgi:hypothetical protein
VDQATKEKLTKEHGELAFAVVAGVEFAFKCPTDTDYEEYQQAILNAGNDRKKIGPAFRQYCLSCVVAPSPDELAAAFRKQPAAPSRIADKLSELAGADVEVTVKKG